jgi:methylisocitrate lyase
MRLPALLDTRTLESLGINVVIYPVTLLRLAMAAADDGLTQIAACGTQESLLGRMRHPRDPYDLPDYQACNACTTGVYNFEI